MELFRLALLILANISAAKGSTQTQPVVDAVAKLTEAYQALRDAMAQDAELTPEHDAAIDAQAAIVFSSVAADPNANV